jgi:hypothetical protein
MSKSKLWKFKNFLIIAMLVLIAVAATPASAVYFSDSFTNKGNIKAPTMAQTLFNIPNLISNSLERFVGINTNELANFTKANILEKF